MHARGQASRRACKCECAPNELAHFRPACKQTLKRSVGLKRDESISLSDSAGAQSGANRKQVALVPPSINLCGPDLPDSALGPLPVARSCGWQSAGWPAQQVAGREHSFAAEPGQARPEAAGQILIMPGLIVAPMPSELLN